MKVMGTRMQPVLHTFLASLASVCFAVGFSFLAWTCLVQTLDQMTQTDCDRGVQAACEALRDN